MKIFAVVGIIRDSLLGLPNADADYVVVGATPEEMQALGYIPVGQDFPVFLHPQTRAEYALARTERKTGVGYKGFTFQASPEVTLEEDLARRDLTINAMARELDVHGNMVGPVIDPYGGQADLQHKIFRHVSPAFIEDPLRILRVARFATRFPDFELAPETLALLKKMVLDGELAHLVPERVWQEISRGLMSKKSSRMLAVLDSCGGLKDIFPLDFEQADILQATCTAIDLAGDAHLSLPTRFAALMSFVEFEQAQAWFERLKVPSDCRAYAEIFRMWRHHYLNAPMNALNMMTWFDRSDAWRKPQRLIELLDLGSILELPTEIWRTGLVAAQTIDGGQIAKLCLGQAGEVIGRTLHQARLKAVEAAL